MSSQEGTDVAEDNQGQQVNQRKFLGIWFECCHVYGRLYKNKQGTHYTGRCPKCLRSVQVRIGGEGEGTNRRFFRGS